MPWTSYVSNINHKNILEKFEIWNENILKKWIPQLYTYKQRKLYADSKATSKTDIAETLGETFFKQFVIMQLLWNLPKG